MEGRTSEVQTGAFLIALRAKGETVPELVGLARTMRSLATPVATSRTDLVDTAGTGGGPSTFNVSTTAALVAAAAGCAVAKHGNRSNTSKCGSADLLEALGVNIELEPEQVGRCIDEVGFGFMFAPRHHEAMAHVVPVRKAARRAHDLQLPRPADQPGRGAGASCSASPTATTRRRSPRRWSASAASGRWSSPPRTASTSSRSRPATRVIEVADGAHRGALRRAGRLRPRRGRARRTSPAARRRRTPPPRARCSTARPGPGATSSCSTPAPRSTSAAAPRASRRGREGGRGDRLGRGSRVARAPDRGDQRRSPSRLRPSSGNDRAADLGSAGRGGGAPRAGPAGGPRVAPVRAAARTGPSARRWSARASR